MSLTATRTARKPHRCVGGDTIEPGERYLDKVFPPWFQQVSDVDETGRTTYESLGAWVHERYHPACRERSSWTSA